MWREVLLAILLAKYPQEMMDGRTYVDIDLTGSNLTTFDEHSESRRHSANVQNYLERMSAKETT